MNSLFNADRLIGVVKAKFSELIDGRVGPVQISLSDALLSAFAMFSLKDPSLLAFDKRREEPDNLKRIYQMEAIPSDTQMRVILDEISPDELRPVYQGLWDEVKANGVLSEYRYLPEGYLISSDGSGYYASSKISCPHCLEKKKRNGTTLYQHQLLGAVMVHPDKAEVLPLFPEPITKQDGQQKNDCERNASKRLIEKLRQEHPELPLVLVEDGLASNGPHLTFLQAHNIRFITIAKAGDHAALFEQIEQAVTNGQSQTLRSSGLKGKRGRYRWVNQLSLNQANPNLLVNVLQFWETDANGKTTHWTWGTDLTLTQKTVIRIQRAARARWKVENETFNTLKNQGYHLEHNFGHGQQFLASTFATLMMLAFLVDQLQQLKDPLFQQVWKKYNSKRLLWERIRALFFDLPFQSFTQLLQALLYRYRIHAFTILNPLE